MQPTVSVERVEPTAKDGDVCHVDQLSERERDCLRRLARDDGSGGVDRRTVASLSEYSFIKATDYVRVTYQDAGGAEPGVGVNS
jgi:hypothetical protein